MTDITIQNDIPLPAVQSGRNGRYPFADMQIGQSFAVEVSEVKSARETMTQLASAAGGWVRRNKITDRRFTCRTGVDADGVTRVRVFCVVVE